MSKRVRGSTQYFLEQPGEESEVLNWLRNQQHPPKEIDSKLGIILHYDHIGPIKFDGDGLLLQHESPLVLFVRPREIMEKIWTVGEVHFFLSPSNKIPEYRKILSNFVKFSRSYPTVFRINHKSLPNFDEYNYYLEGIIKNIASEIFAISSAYSEIRQGRYFISDWDSSRDLMPLKKKLALRGVELPGLCQRTTEVIDR